MFDNWVHIPFSQLSVLVVVWSILGVVVEWLFDRFWPKRVEIEESQEFGFVGSDHEEA